MKKKKQLKKLGQKSIVRGCIPLPPFAATAARARPAGWGEERDGSNPMIFKKKNKK